MRMWSIPLKCPQCNRKMHHSGIYTKVREVIDVDSSCIFEWDKQDICLLKEAKRAELKKKHQGHEPTDAQVLASISSKELAKHCRRKTRGVEETRALIKSLLDSMWQLVDGTGLHLINQEHMSRVWESNRGDLLSQQIGGNGDILPEILDEDLEDECPDVTVPQAHDLTLQLVEDCREVMERSDLVLVNINNTTVSSWLHDRQKKTERDSLLQGVQLPQQIAVAKESLMEARDLPSQPVQHGHTLLEFQEPENHEEYFVRHSPCTS
ncbi:unnamed protein product [Merluccius merluccius]